MQWIIDIIETFFPDLNAGQIVAWHGSILNVPDNWQLCDGTNGTPDLKTMFVVGAGNNYNPDDTGGSLVHTHDGTTDGHTHPPYTELPGGLAGPPAELWSIQTDTFTTDPDGIEPPYYALAYIMKITNENRAYRVTGNPNPDCGGFYKAYGFYEGEPSYKHLTKDYWLRYAQAAPGWVIMDDYPNFNIFRWTKFGGITGDYLAIPPAAGTPKVLGV